MDLNKESELINIIKHRDPDDWNSWIVKYREHLEINKEDLDPELSKLDSYYK